MIMLIYASVSYSQIDNEILNLNDLINGALTNNPQLQSLKSATKADSAKISQSGALPDPILSLNILNLPTNSFAFDQEPMTGKQIGLRQLFPFPGKLSLKEEISSKSAAVSKAQYREYQNNLIKDIKIAYYDLFLIDKSLEITLRNQQLLLKFAKIADTKYSVGNGIQQDVIKAQVEYSKMSDKLIQLDQKRKVRQAQINKLINSPIDSRLGKAVEPDFQFFDQDLDSLKNISIQNRPLLMGWEAMRKQSVLKVDLAKKDYWPDIGIFMAYTQRDELQNGNPGHDFLSGGISLNIPLYSSAKQSKKVEESQYSKNMISESYSEILNQLYFDLENARSSAEKNARLVELFKNEIIPQARQSIESALVGYQTDKIDFLTLIDNQITLFNYNLDYYRALVDYNKDLARLEFLTGTQFLNED
jgi:outer membrane protein TolC